jgi:hypothetical protein
MTALKRLLPGGFDASRFVYTVLHFALFTPSRSREESVSHQQVDLDI